MIAEEKNVNLLASAAGGALGALLRYGVSNMINGSTTSGLPWGTIGVNLAGSFFIGLLSGLFNRLMPHAYFKTFLLIGLIGAFTTFSTYMIESLRLFQERQIGLAVANLLLSNILGLACVLAGFVSVRLIFDILP